MAHPPKEEILSIIAPYLEKIHECIVLAWKDYNKECESIRHKISPRTRAGIVHDNMKYHAKRIFDGVRNVSYIERRGLFLLIFHSRVCIRFKKLDGRMMSSSIPTQQTLFYLNQLEIPEIPEIEEKMIAGYKLDRLQSDIEGIHVTYPRGTRNIPWHLELGVDNVEAMPQQDTTEERKEAK